MRHFLPFGKPRARIPVIRLSGQIGSGSRALSDQRLAPVIARAFKGRPAAVALRINSPGGSPVQSSLIAARIRRLADERGVKVYAFVEDIAASGGYWLASAADEIYVDDSSLIGSIGVIWAGFGLHELMARHGVERRVHTAGRSKSFADPFRPETEADRARIAGLLAPLHQTFIAQITARRGARLDASADLFNADIWLGAEAVRLGLADGIGHLEPKLQALFGPDVALKPMGMKRGLLSRFGVNLAGEALDVLEERAHFARYGL